MISLVSENDNINSKQENNENFQFDLEDSCFQSIAIQPERDNVYQIENQLDEDNQEEGEVSGDEIPQENMEQRDTLTPVKLRQSLYRTLDNEEMEEYKTLTPKKIILIEQTETGSVETETLSSQTESLVDEKVEPEKEEEPKSSKKRGHSLKNEEKKRFNFIIKKSRKYLEEGKYTTVLRLYREALLILPTHEPLIKKIRSIEKILDKQNLEENQNEEDDSNQTQNDIQKSNNANEFQNSGGEEETNQSTIANEIKDQIQQESFSNDESNIANESQHQIQQESSSNDSQNFVGEEETNQSTIANETQDNLQQESSPKDCDSQNFSGEAQKDGEMSHSVVNNEIPKPDEQIIVSNQILQEEDLLIDEEEPKIEQKKDVELTKSIFGFEKKGKYYIKNNFKLEIDIFENLFGYQKEGISWLCSLQDLKNGGGILGDDMAIIFYFMFLFVLIIFFL